MTKAIFCKFDHETSFQATGSNIRFFSPQGQFDYRLPPESAIYGATNLYEGHCHLLTTNGVYEMSSDPDVGIVFRRLGGEL